MPEPLTDEERALLDHLLVSHHQWHPNKKADAWVSSACHLLRRARALLPPVPVQREEQANEG